MESKEPQQSDGEKPLASPKDIYSSSNNFNHDTINGPSGFHIMCTGQIESLEYYGVDNLYCRYAIAMGPDWRVEHGMESGLSQIGYKAPGSEEIVLNFPIDMTFKSTNPYGWPRLVLSVYGVDGLGRDIVRGYGSTHLPIRSGSCRRTIPLFAPQSSSFLQKMLGNLFGNRPEFFDSKFICQNEGREVTRVQSMGKAHVQFNIVTHGMAAHGYTESQTTPGTKSSTPGTKSSLRFY